MPHSLTRHLHISHNAPYLPPKSLHMYCFQILLGRLQYPGEMKKKGHAKFGGGGGGGGGGIGGGGEGGEQGALWEMCKWRVRECGSRLTRPCLSSLNLLERNAVKGSAGVMGRRKKGSLSFSFSSFPSHLALPLVTLLLFRLSARSK